MQNLRPVTDVSSASKPLIGLAQITRLAMNGFDFAPLMSELIARIERDSSDASAWMDLSTIRQIQGDRAARLALQSDALKRARHFTHAGESVAPLRLLALMAPGDFMANTPLEFLLEGGKIALDVLYLTEHEPLPSTLPEHDVAFVAIAESDANIPVLERLTAAAGSWPRPMINDPGHIAGLTRDGFALLMRGAPGAVVPEVRRIGRTKLADSAEALDLRHYPVIVRPVGSHAGESLWKIDNCSDLSDFLAEVVCAEYYVAPFVDYRDADGLYRKYRIVLIDGAPFAVHMAISRHWMIHYLNADMIDNRANRLEEARFMETFETDFARRHAAALHAVHERTGLDYVLLDCAETGTGELLIFEAGTAMIVHSLDPADLFPYKPEQMQKVFAAFGTMVKRKAESAHGATLLPPAPDRPVREAP